MRCLLKWNVRPSFFRKRRCELMRLFGRHEQIQHNTFDRTACRRIKNRSNALENIMTTFLFQWPKNFRIRWIIKYLYNFHSKFLPIDKGSMANKSHSVGKKKLKFFETKDKLIGLIWASDFQLKTAFKQIQEENCLSRWPKYQSVGQTKVLAMVYCCCCVYIIQNET